MSEQQTRCIETEELRIVGRDGALRGVFHAVEAPGHISLDLLNPAGLLRMSLGVDSDDSTRIALVDEAGSVQIGIGCQANGRLGVNSMDAKGAPALILEVLPDGTRRIEIYDQNGAELWSAPPGGAAI